MKHVKKYDKIPETTKEEEQTLEILDKDFKKNDLQYTQEIK